MESLFDACLQDSQLTGVTFGLRIIDRSFAYFRFSLLESLKRRKTGGEVDFQFAFDRCEGAFNTVQLGPVHTYPDIFESATFSFRIRKYPRPHVM